MNDMNYVWSVYDLDMNWMTRSQEFGLQLDTRKHCLLFILLIRLWQVVWRNEACAYCRFAPCQDQQNQHVMPAAAGFSTTQSQCACEVTYQITTQSGRTTCWENFLSRKSTFGPSMSNLQVGLSAVLCAPIETGRRLLSHPAICIWHLQCDIHTFASCISMHDLRVKTAHGRKPCPSQSQHAFGMRLEQEHFVPAHLNPVESMT